MGRFLPLAAAFLCGVLAEAVNYFMTRAALDKKSGAAAIFPLRTVVAALFLASLYYVGKASHELRHVGVAVIWHGKQGILPVAWILGKARRNVHGI